MLKDQYVIQIALKPSAPSDSCAFPFSLPAIRSIDTLEFHPKVTFFVGENGSGKSTLLEAIAISLGFNPEGGTKNFRFGTRESHSSLHEFLRVAKGIRKPRDGYFLRAECFFNVATEIEVLDSEPAFGPPVINSYGGHSLHEQSHGESFFALINHRFGGQGIYILDEPEAALSPRRQMALLRRMHDLTKQRSQFIVATHSPVLMAYPNAIIYLFGRDGIREVAYEEVDHVRDLRQFLVDPKSSVSSILDD
jgi:predicted ATPase